ncbi:glycosyltransferase [Leuconostoc lactis]|uniref:glycosyltransferase n=1 Tax=Leuconostoc lactis TaxID=1246 RepID=UPI002FE1044C
MIFVTVGTHEQSFNRLIKKVDELVEKKEIKEEVFMQIGYSTYEPQNTQWSRFVTYDEMNSLLEKSSTVICHGGPSTYMKVMDFDKTPVVVPRQAEYGEHVNDHQLFVSKQIKNKGYNLIICEDVENIMTSIILSRDTVMDKKISHNAEFVDRFVDELKSLKL